MMSFCDDKQAGIIDATLQPGTCIWMIILTIW